MDNLVEINIERLRYLLRLYNLSEDDLLSMLNKERKRELQKKDIFTDQIRLPLLRQIDAVFNKGLYYYIDFSPVLVDSQNSIFFRKQDFRGQLNLEARKVVDRFESIKKTLDSYAALSDVSFDRRLAYHSLSESAKETAFSVNALLDEY